MDFRKVSFVPLSGSDEQIGGERQRVQDREKEGLTSAAISLIVSLNNRSFTIPFLPAAG